MEFYFSHFINWLLWEFVLTLLKNKQTKKINPISNQSRHLESLNIHLFNRYFKIFLSNQKQLQIILCYIYNNTRGFQSICLSYKRFVWFIPKLVLLSAQRWSLMHTVARLDYSSKCLSKLKFGFIPII